MSWPERKTNPGMTATTFCHRILGLSWQSQPKIFEILNFKFEIPGEARLADQKSTTFF
jgi:hypothetical protein